MTDIGRVTAALEGTGWSLRMVEDEGAIVDTEDGPSHPDVLEVVRGDEVMRFSPSHDDDELFVAICEHQALLDHAAELHAEPEFHCALCREAKAGPR